MQSIRRLNPYLWAYRGLLIPGLIYSVISAIFAVMTPSLVREAVDTIPRMVALSRLYGGTPVIPDLFSLFMLSFAVNAGVIFLLSLIGGVFLFLVRQTVVVASRHIEFDLRNRLYDHIQKLPLGFFQRYSTGDVITRSTSDIEQVRRYVGPALMYVVRAVVVVVVALIAMLIISPELTLWALLPMPLLAIAIFFMSRMIHSRSDAVQKQYASLTSRVQEALAGIRVVKAYTREAYEARAFEAESDAYRRYNLSLARVDAGFFPVFILLIGMSIILVVWIGGAEVVSGRITIGNVAEFMIYVTMMTWPVASFGYVITMVQRASVSADRLFEVLDTQPSIADSESTDTSVSELQGAISFRDVGFAYDDRTATVLERISFDVPAGTTVGIVGRTGSGKSTLVNMIPRLIEPTSGVVQVDGLDVRKIPLAVLRGSIGYVPQDVFLFSDSVGNNIAFGAREAATPEIEQAASDADLLESVLEWQDGFETLVGERGITLSGGQKQRASIARAIIREPRILILDDALSAVDTRTEATILERLRRHYGHRTIVIVSHRISAVQEADLIVVIDEGRITERGTHAQLLERMGLYADLYRKQILEAEIEALV